MSGMAATDKISISIGRSELRDAKRVASRLGLSLSTFITDAVRDRLAEQARTEAAAAVLAGFLPEDRATPEEMAELLQLWAAPPSAPRAKSPKPGKAPQRASRARTVTGKPRARR
jgi:hypothetical protein